MSQQTETHIAFEHSLSNVIEELRQQFPTLEIRGGHKTLDKLVLRFSGELTDLQKQQVINALAAILPQFKFRNIEVKAK